MAEFEAVAARWIEHPEKGGEPVTVGMHTGGKLEEDRPELFAQQRDARLQKLERIAAR